METLYFTIKNRQQCNDLDLIEAYQLVEKRMLDNKNRLEKKLQAQDKNNYLEIYLSRLAYEFSKEEIEILFNEINKRGLVTKLNLA